MCCLITTLLLLGPRAGILIWWLIDNPLWNQVYNGWLVPLLGFIFAPWTTLAYVAVFPGGIQLFDWIILGIAVLLDLSSWFGGYRNRRSVPYVY
jgi:hypothetical protein